MVAILSRGRWVNLLAPGRCGSNFKSIISNSLYRISAWLLTVKLLEDEYHTASQMIVPSDNEPLPEPVLTQIYVTVWHH